MNESSMLASAMPRVERVTVPASCEIGAARLKARITSRMPTSIVIGMLIRVLTSHFTFSLRIRRCRIHGSRVTFSTRVTAAETYRCFWSVSAATRAVERNSTNPCAANRLISDRILRCDSMANASSSRTAARRLMTWGPKCCSMASAFQHHVEEHCQHREQESGAEELRRAEDPHLGAQHLDQGQRGAADGQLGGKRWQGENEAQPVAASCDAKGEEQGQPDAHENKQLQAGRPFDQREMPPRVLQHHRLVDHRQLEMRRRVVDGNAGVLGQRDHDKP